MKLKELFPTADELKAVFTPAFPELNGTPFHVLFYNYFAESETLTNDKDMFIYLIQRFHILNHSRWNTLLQSYSDMLTDLATAGDKRTITNYAAPGGVPEISYSTGMSVEEWSETTTDEDIARLTRVAEVRNFWLDCIREYDTLFIEVTPIWL